MNGEVHAEIRKTHHYLHSRQKAAIIEALECYIISSFILLVLVSRSKTTRRPMRRKATRMLPRGINKSPLTAQAMQQSLFEDTLQQVQPHPPKTHRKRHQKTIKEGEVLTMESPQQQVSYPESLTIFLSHPHSYSCFSKPEAS